MIYYSFNVFNCKIYFVWSSALIIISLLSIHHTFIIGIIPSQYLSTLSTTPYNCILCTISIYVPKLLSTQC